MSSTDTVSIPADHPFASWTGHHAAIRVPDYEVSTRWFTDQLGWRITDEWMYGELQLAYIAPPGDDRFHIEILAGPGAAPQNIYDSVDASLTQNGLNHVCIQVVSVDDSLVELRRRGVMIVGEPFELEAINSRLAFFADPFGNLFELKQPLASTTAVP
jgi:lactoylglutathione lyase/glyoxylase I family protein